MNDLNFLGDSFDELDNVTSSGTSYTSKVVPEVFLIEDDSLLQNSINLYLSKKMGLKVKPFNGPNEILDYLAEDDGPRAPFVVVTDISFENAATDGLYLIDVLKEKGYDFSSIVMTGFASIETAIAATKKGVFHYLTKPFELDVLADLLVRVMTQKMGIDPSLFNTSGDKKKVQKKVVLEEPNEDDIFCGMIGRSKAMKKIFERIKKVAASNSTVLVGGPSGTGKELVARAIHRLSERNNENLVSVNCGAIPGELLESELFGHEKGSFTGAISQRMGRFEVANNGTIFLDEIGDMPLLLQVKLLRVLQNREIERVGSTAPISVDVRIVTATHRDLEKSVNDGDFREDLFYRLNVIPVKIPALKERREDIPLLISYFLSRFVSADGRNAIAFSDETLEILMNYEWPGNVRELENLIERLVILKGGGEVKVEDLPPKIIALSDRGIIQTEDLVTLPEDGLNLKEFLTEVEVSLISQALEKTNGNKNQASKLLSMNRTTLIEKMKKRNIGEISLQ